MRFGLSMSYSLTRPVLAVTAILLATTCFSSTVFAYEVPDGLSPTPVVIQKAIDVIPQGAISFLKQRDSKTARIWVFFTDKGVRTMSEFQASAASITLSEKVKARRAKVGITGPVFADLPVRKSYVEQIVNLGGTLRRESKYLNAASFDLPHETLNQVASLPFVARLQPVSRHVGPLPQVEISRVSDLDLRTADPSALDYGLALDQLQQINVPAAHELGYNGAGVTFAIFDTGYREAHDAFAQHYADGRVLAEWDFVFGDGNTSNEIGDNSGQWDHGTYIWSTAGGLKPGVTYGPAYGANFLLAKTEDIRSETPAEEDNWVAAVEWADSLGADVITSSLTYSDWYNYGWYVGDSAAISIAANTATALGIVVCNAMGNSGPASGTLFPPADAFEILSCGAVDVNGSLASFSSRGPTADGRIKPEVCAQGVATYCATTTSDGSYSTVSGTSLSTPLIAGVVCQLIQARPTFTPQMIRLALMETASRASTPDNAYGWGIIDAVAAIGWGSNFTADITSGDSPITVQFTDQSTLSTSSWDWDFGDGGTSTIQNPTHTYTNPGVYDVSLTINTTYGPITSNKPAYIMLFGDTITYRSDSVYAGDDAVISVELTNSQELNRIIIPFEYDGNFLSYDSTTLGSRTSYFEGLNPLIFSPGINRFTFELIADQGGGAPNLPPGSGEVLKIFFSTDLTAFGSEVDNVDSTNSSHTLSVTSPYLTYNPVFHAGSINTRFVIRGDANGDLDINVADITAMVGWLFRGFDTIVSLQAGDATSDFVLNVNDLNYLVDYLFRNGPPPATP